MIKRPHYMLLSEARRRSARADDNGGRWRFLLESIDGKDRLDVRDEEPNVTGERLELLTVVRGLEALDQPSCVTLITRSRYVHRGLRFGLPHWRNDAWTWEHDGRMISVSNADLWQRMDRALQYHQLRCRWFRMDRGDAGAEQCVGVRRGATRGRWWPTLRRWFRRAAGPDGIRPLRQPSVPRTVWSRRPVAAPVFTPSMGASA